jgi:hypothetical protein
LFEMGRTIPQVAAVSGHRSWTNLKRYTHIRQSKDKYEAWKWLAGGFRRHDNQAAGERSGISSKV